MILYHLNNLLNILKLLQLKLLVFLINFFILKINLLIIQEMYFLMILLKN